MSFLSKRATQKELLDLPSIPFADIRQNMRELEFINTYLGGHAITLKGFKTISRNRKKLSVCEIGSGGGDNLIALHNYCKKKNIDAAFTGIDINKDCVTYAGTLVSGSPIKFIHSDYREVIFKKDKPDIIFTSLFCHHFTEDKLVYMLKWMNENSTAGYFINDLHRHALAYYFIKFATALFSNSYLVKHDAPLSVAKGFTASEWISLLKKAEQTGFDIQWKWAFRHLITVKH